MEIINRHHKMRMGGGDAPELSIWKDKRIALNHAAVTKWKITPGDHLQFLKEKNKWYLLINMDADGFKLRAVKTKNYLLFDCPGFAAYFAAETGIKNPCRLYLQKSETRHNGQQLIEINLNPVDKAPAEDIHENTFGYSGGL